ncbi:hypothetical protein SAMN04487894_1224 [Niabella drilacis]|uniref:Uncharacterized protein n=1 Tax=Niabella drilacis (strain DSM 25811 / CCM 8410 / CCUG 62505 / LMG 26954 / E90) TaxID=1285928 RepID=A0A1G7A8G3_NIADE|nr:hypothetical protein SAMN04487894_1224 [Niabella drilacis]
MIKKYAYLLLNILLLLSLPCRAQQQPTSFRYYVNNHGGIFGADYLTLSSDHYYFLPLQRSMDAY